MNRIWSGKALGNAHPAFPEGQAPLDADSQDQDQEDLRQQVRPDLE